MLMLLLRWEAAGSPLLIARHGCPGTCFFVRHQFVTQVHTNLATYVKSVAALLEAPCARRDGPSGQARG